MRVDAGDGLHLNYIEEGQGDPFLIVAGPGSDNATSQVANLKLLGTHFRTITYDTRGGGESDWSDWYSYKASCDDAAGLLKVLNIEKTIIYGGSNGGIQALHFALNYPEFTRAVIVDGSSAAVNFTAAKNWRSLALKTIQEGRDVMAEVTGPSAVPGGEFKINRKVRQSGQKEPDPKAQFAMLNGIADLYDYPLEPRLKEIISPTLILIGEQDKLAGVGGSVRINRALPGSQLRILPESGHTVLMTTPEVAKQQIVSFVEGLK